MGLTIKEFSMPPDLPLTKEEKTEAMKVLVNMVKKLKLEGATEKPDMSPEHEKQESPLVEEMEHKTDVELGEPMGEVDESKEPTDETNLPDTGTDGTESELSSPFQSDEERMNRNRYKGGKAKTLMSGILSKPAGKAAKGK